ncbi:hypothetical protein TKK_0011553 [Trichogramma kaykai]
MANSTIYGKQPPVNQANNIAARPALDKSRLDAVKRPARNKFINKGNFTENNVLINKAIRNVMSESKRREKKL